MVGSGQYSSIGKALMRIICPIRSKNSKIRSPKKMVTFLLSGVSSGPRNDNFLPVRILQTPWFSSHFPQRGTYLYIRQQSEGTVGSYVTTSTCASLVITTSREHPSIFELINSELQDSKVTLYNFIAFHLGMLFLSRELLGISESKSRSFQGLDFCAFCFLMQIPDHHTAGLADKQNQLKNFSTGPGIWTLEIRQVFLGMGGLFLF